jgi:hypothetical protein
MRSVSGETLRTSDSRIAMWEEETPIAIYSVQLKASGQLLKRWPTDHARLCQTRFSMLRHEQQQDV